MLKKLRLKFIALNMVTVAAVIIVVFSAIIFIDYQQDLAAVREALEASINDAAFQRQGDRFGGGFAGDGFNTGDRDDMAPREGSSASSTNGGSQPPEPSDNATGQGVPPRIGGEDGIEQTIPVAVYRISGESLVLVSTASSAYLVEDDLAAASSAVIGQSAQDGTIDSLGVCYAKRTVAQTTYVAFVDESETSGWKDLAATLALVGIGALAIFFVISLFFSRWALRPVEEAWEKQRRFVSDASHDLKTPLTVILANSSILLDNADETIAKNSQWVESTKTEAEHMKQLVGDLLTMAQIDEGDTAMPRESIDFSTVVQGEFLEFESVAFERKVELESTVEPDIRIVGTPSRIRRLVQTLVDNACKYAPADSTVTLALSHEGGMAKLAVHNEGDPIPAEDLPHIFDRFYRVDKARTNDGDSHGLGLAIAYGIAQEHGGSLEVASTAETGTTFIARLPL